MDLPSLADALILVVLIVPGFVAAKIFARTTAMDRKLSDFDMTVYSFIASLVVYVPFSYLSSLDTIDKIRDAVLMPQTIASLLSLSIILGLGPGLIVKRLFRHRHSAGSVWDSLAKELPEKDVFVLVHTGLGQEIMGRLESVGTGDTPKDIRLLEPKLIIRDKNQVAKNEIALGAQVYLSAENIQSVSIL